MHGGVWAVAMVKDEADVIAGTLLQLCDEDVDGILVADNNSTDGTRDLLADLARDLPLTVVDDPDPGYWQSEKMTALADRAALEHDATWIVPFDADELWLFRGDHLARELRGLRVDVVTGQLYNHFPSAVDPAGDNPFDTIRWRQPHPAPLPKVAFRWRPGAVIQQGNHAVTLPGDFIVTAGGIEIRHFPYRTADQFVRKARNGAAAYAATDLPDDVGAHWRGYGQLLQAGGEAALHDVFRTYFWHLSPADAGLLLDPAPWLRWQAAAELEAEAAR